MKCARASSGGGWIESLEGRRLLSGVPVDDGGVPMPVDPSLPPAFQVQGRWTNTASGSTGSTGNPITLTWGFVNDGVGLPGSNGEPAAPSNLRAKLTALYGSLANAQKVFQAVFDRWSAVSGITYVYTTADDGGAFPSSAGSLNVRPDVRIGGHRIDGSGNTLAYNFFPNGGDQIIDTAEFEAGGYFTNTSSNSLRLRNTVAHESGHGLGLNHVDPKNGTKLMEGLLTTGFDGPQFDDILAVQTLYGDPLEKGGRNETPATARSLGTLGSGSSTLASQVSVQAAASDKDYFTFTTSSALKFTFTLSPSGTTYQQGPQNGTVSSFNAAAQANLALSLYSSNGTSVIASADNTGSGSSESITATLAAGTYYLRVSGSGGGTQMYSLSRTASGSGTTLASASGTVFQDTDRDTTRDSNESGVSGATVYFDLDNDKVLDTSEQRVTTLGDGTYTLSNIPSSASSARLRVVLPSGYTQTLPTSGFGYSLTTSAGSTNAGKNFGLAPPTTGGRASANGVVFQDNDRNGQKGPSEIGVVGATVYFDLDNDKIMDSTEQRTLSGNDGAYALSDIPPAASSARLRVILPSGYVQTLPSNGFGYALTTSAGSSNAGKNFGIANGSARPVALLSAMEKFDAARIDRLTADLFGETTILA